MCTRAPKRVLAAMLALALGSSLSAGETRPDEFVPVRVHAQTAFALVEQGQPAAQIAVSSASELVRNAADWLAAFVRDKSGAELQLAKAATGGSRRLVVAVGEDPGIADLRAAGLKLDPRVGPEGFVLQRVSSPDGGEVLVCWSPAELGCRYGLIEILRSLAGARPGHHHQHRSRRRSAAVSRADLLRQLCRAPAERLQSQRAVRRAGQPLEPSRLGAVYRHGLGLPLQRLRVLAGPVAVLAGSPPRRQDPSRVCRNDQPRDRLCQAARRGGPSDPGGEHGRPAVALPLSPRAGRACGNRGPLGPLVPRHAGERVDRFLSRRSRRVFSKRLHRGNVRRPVPGVGPGRAEEQPGRPDRGRHVGRSDGRLGRAAVDRQTGAGRTGDEVLPGQAAPVPAGHVHQHQPGLQPGLPSDQPRRRRTALRPRGGQDAHRPDLGLQRDRRRGNRLAAVPRPPDVRAAARGVGPGLLFGRHLLHDGAPAPVFEHLLLCRGVVEPVAHA